MVRRLPALIVATALLAALAGIVAAQISLSRERTAAIAVANVDARLDAALLNSEIERFRLVPRALRDDRDVALALTGGRQAVAKLNAKLARLAADMRASVIYLIAANGVAIAASNAGTPQSFVGRDYRFRRYFQNAWTFGEGAQFARGRVSGRPGLFLAARAAEDGVIVIKLEFDRLEATWRRGGGSTYVTGPSGVVLVTSEPARRFATTRPLSPTQAALFRLDASLSAESLHPLPEAGADIVQTVPTAQPGWTLTIRRPLPAAAYSSARNAGSAAALAILSLAAVLWTMRQRAVLIRRRTFELEEAVARRTAELTREMNERAASEARAAELREGLRQANRLATLGQVTASVAHETAQPVAAIRTYAQTTATLVREGDAPAALENLAAMDRLAERIGAVTAELRGFARRKPGAPQPVALQDVLDGAVLILKEQLRDVSMNVDRIDPGLCVVGGRIRLEQVLVNVLQNAADALRARAERRIDVGATVDASTVTLSVSDNGPGVAAEVRERLFTPFVTSRDTGLGLGLVIAHDIMLELGGTLRLAPSSEGARFEIVMVRA